MPSSNILLFDANKANMMSDEQYNTNTQRLNGVQSGIASSQLQNKTLYQVSLVAYAIAQIMNQNGLDANDTAAVSAFVANLSGTMLQKVADLATTEEAQAGVVTGKWMSPALVKAAMNTYTSGKWVPLSGGSMYGPLVLSGNPTQNLQAATKQYVDNKRGIEAFTLISSGSYSLTPGSSKNLGSIPSGALEVLLYITNNSTPNTLDWGSQNSKHTGVGVSNGYYRAIRCGSSWSVNVSTYDGGFYGNHVTLVDSPNTLSLSSTSGIQNFSGTYKLYWR